MRACGLRVSLVTLVPHGVSGNAQTDPVTHPGHRATQGDFPNLCQGHRPGLVGCCHYQANSALLDSRSRSADANNQTSG